MKRYELHQIGVMKKPAMILCAKNEDDAWKKLTKAGIRNKSKLLRLVEVKNGASTKKSIVRNIIGNNLEIPKEEDYKLVR